MKLSKEDLKKKIDEKISDEDLKIELLEDIEDSMEIAEEPDTTAYDELKVKYDELKAKYKERFLSGDDKEDEKEDTPEMKEEEIIDVKEI